MSSLPVFLIRDQEPAVVKQVFLGCCKGLDYSCCFSGGILIGKAAPPTLEISYSMLRFSPQRSGEFLLVGTEEESRGLSISQFIYLPRDRNSQFDLLKFYTRFAKLVSQNYCLECLIRLLPF